MRLLVCIICFLCSGIGVYAQSAAKITGKVLDSATHQPVEYATVTVTDKAAHKVVNGGVTDSAGLFEVPGLPAGAYSISVEFIGYYKKVFDNISISGKGTALNTILLAPAAQALKGVTITGSAPVIENKIDKLVYNAANDITAQGGMALDILKKVPQVNVDIDGNVELQGNPNILFLINGKPSSVFGNSITDALAAIPASQIKSIEVITSPGAKYDAQGTGGIINIILKDNKMQGVNGSVNLSGGTRLENGSANLNIRHNNIGINAYFSGNAQVPSRTPTTQSRTSSDSISLQQDGYNDFQRNGYQGGIGLDWNLTKRDNITAAVSVNHFGNNGNGITNITQDSIGNTSRSVRNSSSTFNTHSVDWSLNYKKTFHKEGEELNVLYSGSYGDPHSGYTQSQMHTGDILPYNGAISDNPGTDIEHNISLDYSYPVTEHFALETGVKTVLQNISSAADVDTLQPDTKNYSLDPGQSYQLNYARQVYAGYLSGSFSIRKLLKVKLGARYEHTDTKIDYPGTTIPPYNTVVPSFILSHDFKNSFIKLAYSRRLERPDYRDINPFVNRSDPYNLTTGNPQLMPEIGNNIELGYNKSFGKGSNLYIGLIERINTQDHKNFTRYYTVYQVDSTVYNNVSVTRVENTGTEYNSGISASGTWTIKDKLSLRSNLSVFDRYLATSIGSGNIDAGIRVRTNLNASYQFEHNLIVEAFGNYNSASGNIQGRSPQSISYTMAFRKQFWNRNASIGVTATNLFNEYTRQLTTVTTPDYSSYVVREVPYRSVGMSFTYKFGKLEFKKPKEDDSFQNNQPVPGS